MSMVASTAVVAMENIGGKTRLIAVVVAVVICFVATASMAVVEMTVAASVMTTVK